MYCILNNTIINHYSVLTAEGATESLCNAIGQKLIFHGQDSSMTFCVTLWHLYSGVGLILGDEIMRQNNLNKRSGAYFAYFAYFAYLLNTL